MATKTYRISDQDMPAVLGALGRWAADIRDHGADAASVKPGAYEQIERLRADLIRQRDAAHTIRDVTVDYLANIGTPYRITIPAGTEVIPVEGGMGTEWAVKSEKLLIDLTGNTHDPKYRYCFVPSDVVAPAGLVR